MTAVELPEVPPLERPDTDWVRHKGTGAPRILPPPGVEWRSASGKTKQRHRYYTRVTTYADAISDQYNLSKWRMRRVALGLGQRSDYVRLAAALTDRDEDRDALDELVEKALEAAGPNKADEGTALHALTERVDRGEPLGNVPEEFVPDLTAYEVLSGELFRFVHREARTVCDDLEVAGTPDGHAVVGELPPTEWGPRCDCPPTVLRIIDTKTGSIRYPAKMAIQLAIYAHSALYDPSTGERTPVEVCPHWGVIVHLAVETGLAAPFWLDLERGWHGAELCGPVREWNAQRPDDIAAPFIARPVLATADGEVTRPEPRLASHNPKQRKAAAVELPEFAVPEPGAVPAPLSAVDSASRCPTTDLLVGECACRVHRPDLAAVGDDGVQPDDEPAEFDLTVASGPDGGVDDDDEGERRESDDQWHGDPIAEAILGAITDRDLELLWQRHKHEGIGWGPEHLKLATERVTELKANRDAERPRAAMRAAIETCTELAALTELMVAHRDDAFMTDELFALADARFWTLKGQGRPRVEAAS